MLTSKQRAKLKSLASAENAIFQVGKAGIGEQLTRQVEDALRARELVKVTVLETSPEPVADAAARLADACDAELVQVIGRRFVLYRRNPEKPVIEL